MDFPRPRPTVAPEFNVRFAGTMFGLSFLGIKKKETRNNAASHLAEDQICI